MSIKLTPRQRQIAILKQRGAANKEIAIVLDITEDTVKSMCKRIREKCKEFGVDMFAMPTDRQERMKAFRGLVRAQKIADNFGGERA
jgi:DNA-binding NarL/FixJ family response regulator